MEIMLTAFAVLGIIALLAVVLGVVYLFLLADSMKH
jgi:hypothetical protein